MGGNTVCLSVCGSLASMEAEGEEDGGHKVAENEVCIDLDWEDSSGLEARKRTLIGRIVADKVLNKNAVRNMIAKAWGLSKGLGIQDMGENCFRFSFDRDEDCRRVLKGRPWMILGNLLVLEVWQSMLTLEEISLSQSPFWIQLFDLPLEGLTVKNITRIGNFFGEVLAVEDPVVDGRLMRHFARVRVLVDTNKSLIPGVFVPRPGRAKIWIKARYEKL